MPVLYKPFQSTLEDKKSGKKLFYPRVVRSGNVDSAQLSKEIAAYSSLSPPIPHIHKTVCFSYFPAASQLILFMCGMVTLLESPYK